MRRYFRESVADRSRRRGLRLSFVRLSHAGRLLALLKVFQARIAALFVVSLPGRKTASMLPRDLAMMASICLVWAFNAIVSKIVIGDLSIPPLFYGFLRCLIIAIVVFPWLLPMPPQRLRLIAATFLIGGGSFAIYFVGLKDATPSSAAIVTQIGMPITTLLSVVMLGETIRWRRALGIILTFVGTMIVMWDPGGFSLSSGLGLIALSSAGSSLGAILMKQVKNVKPLQFQAWGGLSALLPLGLASAVLETGQLEKVSAGGWTFAACLAFSALIVSVIGHTAYYALIKRYDANLISPLVLMTPLFTVVLGILLLGDHFDMRMAIGGACTLLGVLIIALRRNHVMPRAMLVRERA